MIYKEKSTVKLLTFFISCHIDFYYIANITTRITLTNKSIY